MKFDETLMTFVRKDLEKNLIPMLLGEPGIGKSSWLIALAKSMHTKCFVLACNQLADKADLTGARLVPIYENKLDSNGQPTDEQIIVDYKQMFYPHAVIHDAIKYAEEHPRETPILFMDELNRTTPDVTSEALSIPTLRSIGSKELPPNLRVVIAGNDKGNVTSLDEASVSRFVLYRVTPDVNTFLSVNPELNVFVKNVLNAHPECIFGKTIISVAGSQKKDDDEEDDDIDINEILDDGEEMAQITTPRTIAAVSDWLNQFSSQELMAALANTYIVDGQEMNALKEAIEGHVGQTLFTSYLLAEIATNVMTTNNQVNVQSVGKPQCYDVLKASPDRQTMENTISTLSVNDRSGCMLYALYEKDDNTAIITTLAPHMNNLESDDVRTLMQLAATNQLDKDNAHVLLETDSDISRALTMILEMAA